MPFKVYDAALGQTVQHWPLLVAGEGDTPMQANVGETTGHSGKRGCASCAFPGVTEPGKSDVKFLGYSKRQKVHLPVHRSEAEAQAGKPRKAFAADPTEVHAWDERLLWCASASCMLCCYIAVQSAMHDTPARVQPQRDARSCSRCG